MDLDKSCFAEKRGVSGGYGSGIAAESSVLCVSRSFAIPWLKLHDLLRLDC